MSDFYELCADSINGFKILSMIEEELKIKLILQIFFHILQFMI